VLLAGRPRAGAIAVSGPARDRDEAGRPRNARPRDGLGRPLARGAAGDQGPGPGGPALPPPGQVLPPAAALALAQQLLDAGRPFHAHEVLEDAWKAAPDAERALWKGLAQLAVGVTHARRGNARGAAALLRRGAAAVDGFPGRPHGIDAPGLAAAARSLAALIERAGLAAVPAGALDLRLTVPAGGAGPQDSS
jgi:uncharacterized protein